MAAFTIHITNQLQIMIKITDISTADTHLHLL